MKGIRLLNRKKLLVLKKNRKSLGMIYQKNIVKT